MIDIIELGAALEYSAKIELNADLYAIGGVARDFYAGRKSNDLDMECYGDFTIEEFVAWLNTLGDVSHSGRKFPVWRVNIDGILVEISLPRTDNLVGEGHYQGTEPSVNTLLTFFDAVQRRDFTMNAMLLRCSTLELIDPTGWGKLDIDDGCIVHTSDERFPDDALRVLRGAQQAARFKMTVLIDTAYMCGTMKRDFHTLDGNAQWHEWEKLLLAPYPSYGLRFLRACSWTCCYPDLHRLIGCAQDPEHHPEGDAWEHTLATMDAAADKDYESREQRLTVVTAALCHDFGKPMVSEIDPDTGRIRTWDHHEAGVEPAQTFLQQIGAPDWLIAKVLPLVREHMWPVFMGNTVSPRSVRRLANRLDPANMREWLWVMHADSMGRPGRDDLGVMPFPALKAFVMARRMEIDRNAPPDILRGQNLLDLGQVPGKHIGEFLRRAKEAQLDGEFTDLEGALEWAKERL